MRTKLTLVALAAAFSVGSAFAVVTDYTTYASWLTAVGGSDTTIDFIGLTDGNAITTDYPGILFSNTTAHDNGAFLLDGEGATDTGSSPMVMMLSSAQTAVGFDFPGALSLELYNAGNLVGTSASFGGSGAGFFGGVTSTVAFDEVRIFDWVDQEAFIDNAHLAAVPEPTTMAVLALGALGAMRRRRK